MKVQITLDDDTNDIAAIQNIFAAVSVDGWIDKEMQGDVVAVMTKCLVQIQEQYPAMLLDSVENQMKRFTDDFPLKERGSKLCQQE